MPDHSHHADVIGQRCIPNSQCRFPWNGKNLTLESNKPDFWYFPQQKCLSITKMKSQRNFFTFFWEAVHVHSSPWPNSSFIISNINVASGYIHAQRRRRGVHWGHLRHVESLILLQVKPSLITHRDVSDVTSEHKIAIGINIAMNRGRFVTLIPRSDVASENKMRKKIIFVASCLMSSNRLTSAFYVRHIGVKHTSYQG